MTEFRILAHIRSSQTFSWGSSAEDISLYYIHNSMLATTKLYKNSFCRPTDPISFINVTGMTLFILFGLKKHLSGTYNATSPKNMDDLLALPFWRLKPYVRPAVSNTNGTDSDKVTNKRKKGTSTLEQNKRRKEQKVEQVKKYYQKALNKVFLNNFWWFW